MKNKITAYNIVKAIGQLKRNIAYDYISPRTRTKIHIENVIYPAGPIQIKRWNPTKGETIKREELDGIVGVSVVMNSMLYQIT